MSLDLVTLLREQPRVQPCDDVLRDSAKWRAWCWEQVGREPTGEPKAATTEVK